MATQLHSSHLSAVEQGVLPLVSRVIPADVSVETIMKRRDLLGAINLMFDASGLDDKEIYMALDIDPGHFSNIRRGKPSAHFPINKLNAAMDLCQSEIRVHPNQKPVAVMAWAIDKAKLAPNSLILDPYMGSGTTGIAALQAGHRFVGIEAHEPYFVAACERVENAQRQERLIA